MTLTCQTGEKPRRCTEAERRLDHAIHWTGLAAATLAVPLLLISAARWHGLSAATIASIVYAATLIAMLGFSAAYHMNRRPLLRDLLRRGDHAAIFAKIAGTYTPFAVLYGGAQASRLLAILWAAALLGILVKLARPRRFEGLAVLFYLTLGWGAMVIGLPVIEALSPMGQRLALAGGALYTIGIIFHLWERLPYQNAIWHAFVLTATALCFVAVLVEMAAAAA